jgi:NitT/TauT family transport system permease protein
VTTAVELPQRFPRPRRPVRRRGLAERAWEFAPAVVVFLAVLLVWEFGLLLLGVRQFLLPRPSVIATALVDQWEVLQRGVVYTGFEALAGLLVGVSLGVAAAFATSRWATAREMLMPVAVAASSIPIIAFAPITSAWFSSQSPASRIAIVTLMVFFPVMVNTVRGLTNVEPAALELMRSYAASDGQILRKVRIPNAMPYFFTALRIAATLAVIGAVIGEYFGGPRFSLGIFITSEAYVFRYPNAWAAIVLACLLGVGFYLAVLVLERIAMPWYDRQRSTAG